MRAHWTERSIKDYLFRIAADFLAQLEKKMESSNISQDELAERLGKTKGRISQVLNHPANITLSTIIKYARTLGMKVSIVAYEDDDPLNKKGPINSEIFKNCWEKSGKPCDFWAFQEIRATEKPPVLVDRSVNDQKLTKEYQLYFGYLEQQMHGMAELSLDLNYYFRGIYATQAFTKGQKLFSPTLDHAYKHRQESGGPLLSKIGEERNEAYLNQHSPIDLARAAN